jgi:molecular chaperone DnaJ
MVFTRACAACRGTGLLDRHPCDQCGAEGRLMQSEWLEVQIPAGVENGSRVRLPGCGNAGRRGGPAGDFVLRVEVEPHEVFRREGADLRCSVPVTMMEAALGAHVEVPTPDGPMTIEIPAGTQNGQQFRLRKRGMPRPGEKARGDLWVEAQLLVPHVRDERSRELLRELQRLNPMDPRQSSGGPGAQPRAGERPRGPRGEE